MNLEDSERRCICGKSLAGSHFNRIHCAECAVSAARNSDRVAKGITLANDAIVCPVCNTAMNSITAGHFRKHGYSDAKSFKKAFGLTTLRARSICERHSNLMTFEATNKTKGRVRSEEEKEKMSSARKGKGIGVAGKYARTPEIRSKISRGVVAFMANKPDGYQKRFFKSKHVNLDCCGPEVWVRSSWEERTLTVLNGYSDDIKHVTVEPFTILYTFDGVERSYIPDFLVEFECGITELWEVKPQEMLSDLKTAAKIAALRDFASKRKWNARIVTLKDIKKMEGMLKCKQTKPMC